MAISSFLVLSLALLAQARPKHAFEPEDAGNAITLPVVLSSSHSSARGVEAREGEGLSRRGADDEEDKPFHILPFPYKRDVEGNEEEDKPFHILPFPYRRDVESSHDDDDDDDDEDKPFHILPFPYPNKRTLVVEDDDGAAGAITLPVPRPSRRNAQDDEDKPFHILPFNSKRKLPVEDSPSRTITLPIIHARRANLDRRAVEVQVENRSDVSYYAQLNIGTPPQAVYAQIDTGSFELWVNPDCSNVAASDQRFCRAIGVYDPRSSSTSGATQKSASLRYGVGSANVTYFLDSISLAGSAAAMKQVQFGVADSSADEFSGILGIGAGEGFNTGYKNFVDELAAQGVTNTKAFSLALGGKAEEEGVIVFGGVDTAKFRGKLASLPIVPAGESPDGVARYWVDMESIALTRPGGEPAALGQTSMTVFLDSGSTLTLLPPSVVRQIASGLGSSGADGSGFYVVDCGLADEDGTIDFSFDGVTIAVPYSEMVRQAGSLPPQCYLGMVGSTEFALLGDTFLRSAYAVFDLSGNMVHLAPYSNCGTNVQSITSTSSLRGLSGDCSEEGNSPSPSPSPPPPSSASPPASKAASQTAPAPTAAPPQTSSPPSDARPSSDATATAANAPKSSSATGVADASSGKNGAGRSRAGAQALGLSVVVLAAMGLLVV
ncbi:eukaryotic aspartyl protease [Trichoderma cornu-damae]|uniref:Eukaryotic aspartyl protease n=1 Tax=Trichoderma cornu-damae TaxID=654480 RepID=A0A9P8TU28_9HYPO|nr:eukaryotic aspartyl protease [Trichoderma cornu-damae]